MNNIILLEQTHTDLKEDYVWQHYTVIIYIAMY